MNSLKSLNPDALLDEIGAACAPFGQVASIKLFCRIEQSATCFAMVRMDQGLEQAAEAIGGKNVQGLVCKLAVLDAAFRCHNRPDGAMRVASCNDCSRTASPVRPG